jgi:hypothetical protein
MIGHDRLQLLAYAAAIATGLADQGGWQVEKYDPTQLETLLADLTLARFDGALQTLSGQAARQHGRALHNCLLFIPDAQNLPPTQLRQLLRLLHGTGHRRLRIVALFSSSALACEAQVAELGTRVARWYLDEAPSHLPDHAMLSATLNHSTRSARRQRSPLSRQHKPVRAGFTLAASLMLALLFGLHFGLATMRSHDYSHKRFPCYPRIQAQLQPQVRWLACLYSCRQKRKR